MTGIEMTTWSYLLVTNAHGRVLSSNEAQDGAIKPSFCLSSTHKFRWRHQENQPGGPTLAQSPTTRQNWESRVASWWAWLP
jgi:hypothetical protein